MDKKVSCNVGTRIVMNKKTGEYKGSSNRILKKLLIIFTSESILSFVLLIICGVLNSLLWNPFGEFPRIYYLAKSGMDIFAYITLTNLGIFALIVIFLLVMTCWPENDKEDK